MWEEWFHVAPAQNEEGSVVYYCLRCKGILQQTYDLHRFPLDDQELVISLQSYNDKDVQRLVQNLSPRWTSRVDKKDFGKRNEFQLSDRIKMVPGRTDPYSSATYAVYSRLDMKMHVNRQKAFWMWNVILFPAIFVLASFSSCEWLVSTGGATTRMGKLRAGTDRMNQRSDCTRFYVANGKWLDENG